METSEVLGEDGYVTWRYFRDGKLHRDGGPAVVQRREADDVLIYEAYYRDGVRHRDGQEPAEQSFDESTGRRRVATWWYNGDRDSSVVRKRGWHWPGSLFTPLAVLPSVSSPRTIYSDPFDFPAVRTHFTRMCGRFTRKYTWREIYELYQLTSTASNVQPRYNVCPNDPVDTVIEREGKRELVQMRWGLIPAWWQKPLKAMKLATFNARAESVTEKPMFREAFKRHRCLIPASGYYEWQDTPGGKQPHYFTRRDGKVVTIAGIWDRWKNRESGETIQSCAMIIAEPNAFTAEVHDRMPVILEENDFEPWLSGNAGMEMLKPAKDDVLQRWPVSKRVNSSHADAEDATLIEPLAA